jgi:8-oxo-dGTP pyrophosphatase MutT (NUDIX family)
MPIMGIAWHGHMRALRLPAICNRTTSGLEWRQRADSALCEAPELLQNIIRTWNDRIAIRAGGSEAARQSGAIPYTVVQGQAVFLIITSRRTGRWIFPKGAPIEGMKPWEVAARESYEEAGIEGDIETQPIGSYRTLKTSGILRSVIEVDMYPLRLTHQLDDWPEKGSRHRHWVILSEAKRLLSEPRLAEFAAVLARRVASTA